MGGRAQRKNKPPQGFARELRATGGEWGSLVACCVLADLNEWVVLNKSVMPMADEYMYSSWAWTSWSHARLMMMMIMMMCVSI